MSDTDMLYMASLEKRNAELEEKVAELEGKHWNECRQIAHYDDELSKYQKEMPKIVEYIDYLRSLPANRWISVKERLPDEMQDKSIYSGWSEEIRPSDSVLVLTTGGSYDVAWYSYVYNDWTTDNEAYTYKNWEIAFWQPLPEPPKDGDAND